MPNNSNEQNKKQRSNLSKQGSEIKVQEKKKTIDDKQVGKEINKHLTKPKVKTMPFKKPAEKEVVKTKKEPKKERGNKIILLDQLRLLEQRLECQ